MTADIEKLKALALAATPGEWKAQRQGVVIGGPLRKYARGSAQSQIAAFSVTFDSRDPDDEPERQQANAEFCAAANPAAVLELITDNERLRAEAKRYRWLRDKSEPGICAFYLSVGQAFKGVKFTPETVDAALDDVIEKEKA